MFETIGTGCGALFCADAADTRLAERANAAIARDNVRGFMGHTFGESRLARPALFHYQQLAARAL
jgi:hypothetical protein